MYVNFFKRIFDFVASLVGFLLFSPIFALIAIVIKLEDGGSVFFKQTRVGRNWQLFKIIKFRTMVVDAEKKGKQITTANDPRVTKVGKFLRKYKLDEFPQLINVIIGDMSLVGPRPEVPKYAKLYIDDYDLILKVRPGITDYASIYFIEENKLMNSQTQDPEEKYIKDIMPAKIELYKKYVNEMSFWVDLKLIFLTLLKILKR